VLKAIVLLPIVSCGVAMAAAVTTPIMATITNTTYVVGENGQATVVHQETGTFARAGDGRELRVMFDPKTNEPKTAILRANGEDVSMGYASKRYTVSNGGPLAPHEIPFVPKPGIESQTINGVYAVAIPNYDANNPGKVIGKAWFSPDYKLTVRSESEMTTPNGKKIRVIMEMNNIRIGTEPDQSQFVVPQDFTPATGSSQCSVCGGSK
jgi:hypothetical protein